MLTHTFRTTESKPLNILLVEDNPVEQKMLETIFTANRGGSRNHVTSAETLAAALDQRGRPLAFDLVLLDLNLPDSEGFSTFEKMQSAFPDTAIVVLTGTNDENIAMETLRCGAQDYWCKGSLEPKLLVRVCRYAVERKRIELELKHANDQLKRHEDALLETLESLKKSNEDLRATRLQLIQAAKLEVVGRLAAGIAHEVKNPLAMIRMGVDYFFKYIPADEKTGRFMLESMSEAVGRADMVIKEMLDFSSQQALVIQPESLTPLIERALFFVKHEFDKRQTQFEMQLQEGLPLAFVDKTRMEQVLINLMTNALQAQQSGGTIRLKTCFLELQPGVLPVGNRRGDPFVPGDKVVRLDIEDEGPGIPADVLGKIFDPFFTTKRAEGGTGLGLSVVKNIIEMHGGFLCIRNRSEGGVCATVLLKPAEAAHDAA